MSDFDPMKTRSAKSGPEGNMTKLEKLIADSLKQLDQHEANRSEENAEMAAIREVLAAKGISKKALAAARTYMKLDPDDREGFDIAYALVRKVGGLPMQDDLFAAAERKAKEEEENKKTERPGADPAEIEKVIASQESEKTKGKTVLPSSTGAGTIN